MRTQNRRLKPRTKLRGTRLEEAALRELAKLDTWQSIPISWEALATRLGVSRQALAKKVTVKEALRHAKSELKKQAGITPDAVVKRTLQARIAELKNELKEKDRQLDAWVQKWATIEANCSKHAFPADKILEPLLLIP